MVLMFAKKFCIPFVLVIKFARTWWKFGRIIYFSFSLSVMTLSSENVRGSNITFPVSVLMEYISLSNIFLIKLMELFNIITITFFIFLWHIFFSEIIQNSVSSTSSSFPHPLCTNEHWAENVLYGVLTCYHLYSPFPLWYGFIITLKMRFVQSEKAIADYIKKQYQSFSRIWYHTAFPCTESEIPSLTYPNFS